MTTRKRMLFITTIVFMLTFGLITVAFAEGPTPESNEIALNTVWTILGGILVFIMHAGFTLVESGFTRAKNSVNIIMKNLTTIAIGFLSFYFIGFALMFGPSIAGFIGTKGFALTSLSLFDFGIPTEGFWFFQGVFAATSATIVSGAMAERTKFLAYLLFTVVITSVIYPVVGHWIWGGGWLAKLGFIDFAGSTVVHSVGGWAAVVGASMVGARLGKFGPDGKPKAMPGHSFPLGALGVLLLWFGWFGFNAGSTLSGTNPAIATIVTTTTLAASAGLISSIIYTAVKYGKPDASISLNGALGGLVGITAGTAAVSPAASIVIGAIGGIIIVVGVEFIEKVLKIDDPVGAIAVHALCGVWGTMAVGLFALEGGLFYGGGVKLLGVQALGVVAVAAWTIVTSLITFKIIKAVMGLRVSADEEIEGLDFGEHGIKAYGDFVTQSRSSMIPGAQARSEII